MKKIFNTLAGLLLAILLIFSILWLAIPKAGDEFASSRQNKITSKTIHYAALGDSLTEGIGDATNQGGFVPLFAKKIENKSNATVKIQNFGKAGDTSAQIYSRMTSKADIEAGLKSADVITITVGGNDVMKVLRENIANISNMNENDFVKPAQEYQSRLKKIFARIRQSNSKAQIYVLGIYNPFYLNFPDITVMQDVINNWNQATEEVVNSQANAYFVPINDLLYKGTSGQAVEESTSSTDETTDVSNNLLYTGDHFHPNNTGYQIMADAVFKSYEKINH